MVVARFIERVHVMSKASTSTRAKRTTKRATAKNAKGAAKTASTPRTDSKQSQLIAMLKQPDGATIAEIAKALEWQPHTVIRLPPRYVRGRCWRLRSTNAQSISVLMRPVIGSSCEAP